MELKKKKKIQGDDMEKVSVEPLDYWGWECLTCDNWNETQDDPEYKEFVGCDKCGEKFEPVMG